ncbi:Na+/H+ antiporter NhaA, partial [Flavobacterium lindanitolerans]
NAGVVFDIDFADLFSNNIFLGIVTGLIVGKFLGIFGITFLLLKLKLVKLPKKMTVSHLLGISVLSGIGFTMCLFITTLAYDNPQHVTQAKIAIFAASIIAGISGYILLNRKPKNETGSISAS